MRAQAQAKQPPQRALKQLPLAQPQRQPQPLARQRPTKHNSRAPLPIATRSESEKVESRSQQPVPRYNRKKAPAEAGNKNSQPSEKLEWIRSKQTPRIT